MIRPPCGSCAFIIRTAWCAHRYEPVRLTATMDCQPSGEISSTAPAGAPVPALLTSRASRPCRSATASNSAATESASVASAATGGTEPPGAGAARLYGGGEAAARPGDLPARFGQRERDLAAETGARPGDDRHAFN